MVDEERLESFMMEVPIIQKPAHSYADKSMDMVSIRQELLS